MRHLLTTTIASLVFLALAGTARAEWVWPLRGPVITTYRNGDDPYAGGQHRGVDIAGSVGARVVAAAGGEVQFAGTAGSSGLTVGIRTGDGFDTSYLHLSSVSVREGQLVSAGDALGAVGTTGSRSASEPHLHFGVREAGTRHAYRNPLDFLPPAPAPPAPEVPRSAPGPVPVPTPLAPAPVPAPARQPGRVPVGGRAPGRVPVGGRTPGRVPAGGRAPRRVPSGGQAPGRVPAGERAPGRIPAGGRVPERVPAGGPDTGQVPVGGPVPRRVPAGDLTPRGIPAVGRVPAAEPRPDATPGRPLPAGAVPAARDAAQRVPVGEHSGARLAADPGDSRAGPQAHRLGPSGGAQAADARAPGEVTTPGAQPATSSDDQAPGPDIGWIVACAGLLAAAALLGLTEDGRRASRKGRGHLARVLRPLMGRG